MTALATNRARLVRVALAGRIAPARIIPELSSYDADGRSVLLPGCGGIALGVHVGDEAGALLGDHLMPGASIEAEGDPAVPGPLHELASIGNRVRDGAGRPIGVVAGKRGGLAPGFMPPNLVAVEAPDERLAALAPGDRVVLEAEGRGLALTDFPDIGLFNLSPAMLDRLPLAPDGAGGLACAVRAVVPAAAAGAGVGQSPTVGDVEIAAEEVLEGSLTGLAFGDLIAFRDLDSRVSRFFRPGRVTIGILSHGPSPTPGHGPGVTVLLTGPADLLHPAVSPTATLAPALLAQSIG
jgi:hypothetical protein